MSRLFSKRSRKRAFRIFTRWFLYVVLLLWFYVCQCNPIIRGYCPLLLIPLATAVAMWEGDLSSGIFGVICGIMLDTATGKNVVGFSALWLLAACPLISLLTRFWVKKNFLSYFIFNTVTASIMAAMDMLFLHWVWEGADSVISFQKSVFPAYGGAILFSVPVYFLVRLIYIKSLPKEERRLEESAQNAENADEEN